MPYLTYTVLYLYRSPGEILSLLVKDFEALSRNGHVEIIAGNTGYIASDYWVSVTNCTEGIQPIPAQTATIAPLQSSEFNFDLYAANELGSLNQCDGKWINVSEGACW